MPTITMPNCAFNIGVNCGNRHCWDCGWNPVVTMKRKEALRGRLPNVIKARPAPREKRLIGSGEFPKGWGKRA